MTAGEARQYIDAAGKVIEAAAAYGRASKALRDSAARGRSVPRAEHRRILAAYDAADAALLAELENWKLETGRRASPCIGGNTEG